MKKKSKVGKGKTKTKAKAKAPERTGVPLPLGPRARKNAEGRFTRENLKEVGAGKIRTQKEMRDAELADIKKIIKEDK